MQYRKLMQLKTYNEIAHELELGGFDITNMNRPTFYKRLCKEIINDDLFVPANDAMLRTSNQIAFPTTSKPRESTIGYIENGRLIIKKAKVCTDLDQTPWVAYRDVS